MQRFSFATLSMLVLALATASAATAAPKAKNTARERPDVYTGLVTGSDLRKLVALGVDRHELDLSSVVAGRGRKARMRVEVILSGRQAEKLAREGVELEPKQVNGATVAERATARAAAKATNVFRQYYLGAYVRASVANPETVFGIAPPIDGYDGDLGGPVVSDDNPLDEAGFFQPTSDVLPVAQFPQFASRGAAEYRTGASNPFAQVEGERYAGALHADDSYMRLTRTVDVPAGPARSCSSSSR